MTKDQALKRMYGLLLTEPHTPTVCEKLEAIAREALAQPVQEPIYKITVIDNAHPKGIPFEDWVQPEEREACARCKDLEEQAYDLLGKLKVANLKWSVAHPWVGLDYDELIERAKQEECASVFSRGAIWGAARLREKNA